MTLTHHDLQYFDQRIDQFEGLLSTSEKKYASRVCDTVFEGLLPNATWLSPDSSLQFNREIKVEHFNFNGIPTLMQNYIKIITCKRFVESFTNDLLFQFDMEYLGTEDDCETEDITPMYWGDNLKDKYKLSIKLGKVL